MKVVDCYALAPHTGSILLIDMNIKVFCIFKLVFFLKVFLFINLGNFFAINF